MRVKPDLNSIQLTEAIDRLERLKEQVDQGDADEETLKLATAVSTSVLSMMYVVKAWE